MALPPTVEMSPQRKDRNLTRTPRSERVITSAGLLTRGSRLCWAFPWCDPQWHLPTSLSAHSCGGSCGFGRDPHHIPFSSDVKPEPKCLSPNAVDFKNQDDSFARFVGFWNRCRKTIWEFMGYFLLICESPAKLGHIWHVLFDFRRSNRVAA